MIFVSHKYYKSPFNPFRSLFYSNRLFSNFDYRTDFVIDLIDNFGDSFSNSLRALFFEGITVRDANAINYDFLGNREA